ncbi:LysR substrate-binding domain-containing protein [Pseudomonas kuykendallii]|uniref:LysR family transcriptional regulator n=1 Tax=Pseudomonas kuykendallii TaxID=1007099 RepID=A0A2W5DEB4_9PSED|nr:LysR substrate-binding domain-containing protein [Pseudomonas kuykendallii]PZP26730.1 MAG: LysR family transcriptional regulator [Pseudomonas kuykendallii]
MRFDLTDLRLFLNVHEAGTITAGAQRSHMTLASASERIRGMEELLGVALLERDRRGVEVTAAGRTLAQHARIVLQQMDRLRGDLGQYGRGLKGQVRLLCNTAALSEHLPEILGRFLRGNPQISLNLEEKLSYEIVDALRQGLCDLGIVSDATDVQGLQVFPFRHDPLDLVVPREHPLAGSRGIGLAEVSHYDFIGLVEGSALQDHVAHHARRLGKRLNYRVQLRSFESICRMVGQGIGVAIVPRTAAIRCARSMPIKRIALSDAWASRSLVLCVRSLDELPPHARLLAQYILHGGDAAASTDDGAQAP